MASKSLTFELFGVDKTASKAIAGVGDAGHRMGQTMKKVGFVVGAALGAAAIAAVKFGIDSVKAFAVAEESQNKLAFAFERFPALADTNQKALQNLNSALQAKTRFDDDQIAVGQSVLAQYGLTGKQLKQLTPLLLDYAARTGKDVVTASEDLGKALLGQGRALKDVGIDFADAGSVAGNFDQLMQGLSSTVGGFAEKDAETAAGKLEQLQNRFGDIQEKIGEALIPALVSLMDTFEEDVFPGLEDFAGWFATEGTQGISDFVGWVIQYRDILGPTAVALGVLTAAQWLLNIAMDANPVGVVILAFGALITIATLVATNFDTVTKVVLSATGSIGLAIIDIALAVGTGVQGMINAVLGGIGVVVGAVNTVRSLFGLGSISVPTSVNFMGSLTGVRGTLGQLVAAGAAGGLTGMSGLAGTLGSSGGGGAFGITGSGAAPKAFADGGLVKGGHGGVLGLIGEKSYDELVVPLKPGMSLGGGTTIVYNVRGAVVTDRMQLAKLNRNATRGARRRGFSVGDTYASA